MKTLKELKIELKSGKIDFTKEELMAYNGEIALELASESYKNNWKTNDKDILLLQNGFIAWWLAFWNGENKWTTKDKEILMLKRGYVAHQLLKFSIL